MSSRGFLKDEGWLHFLCKRERAEAEKGRGLSIHIFSHGWVAGLRPALNDCLVNHKPSLQVGIVIRQGNRLQELHLF